MSSRYLICLLLFAFCSCRNSSAHAGKHHKGDKLKLTVHSTFFEILADSAMTLTEEEVKYDPAYYQISYPNGDIPADRGGCTDVIIRTYRKLGIDLQKAVHEDIDSAFNLYPHTWGLTGPDKNIDHRRVSNLMTFFTRKGASLPITGNPNDYLPGDVVAWDMGKGLSHIGIVVNDYSSDKKRHMIVHNIGTGQELADFLFERSIAGHYRYRGN